MLGGRGFVLSDVRYENSWRTAHLELVGGYVEGFLDSGVDPAKEGATPSFVYNSSHQTPGE